MKHAQIFTIIGNGAYLLLSGMHLFLIKKPKNMKRREDCIFSECYNCPMYGFACETFTNINYRRIEYLNNTLSIGKNIKF